MHKNQTSIRQRKLSWLKIVSYASIAIGAIVIICVLTLLIFSDPLMNRFIKPRIAKVFTEAYPAYSISIADMNYSILKNRLGFDSVALKAVDGTFSANMASFSVKGIEWMHLLWRGSLTPNDFGNSVADAQDIKLNFPQSQYKLHCGLLHVSVPDSEIVVEALKLHPSGDDEQFFAGNNFRKTRFHIVVPNARVMGLACLELFQGKMYHARSIRIHNVFLDILVNKDKPDSKDTSGPFMPNEILSSIKNTLQIDSLRIINGQLKYGERFEVDSKPALITFNSVQVLAEGIANYADRGAALVIHAQGIFVDAGTMKVFIRIPLTLSEFSFQYSGSLSRMDLSPINSFLEVSDQIRIKTGVLQEAAFEVNVVSGCASGNLRGVYSDLVLAAINKHTGSEKGISNGITSFIANTFKVRKNNVPDKSGSIKIGKVKYIRQPDDPFVQFMWFALRTAVQDVIGF